MGPPGMNGREGPLIEWGSAGRAIGEADDGLESGDRHVVALFPDGALVAVIDGLGHGTEAARAALAAAHLLEQHPDETVVALIQRCHDALRRTRGAVMSVASFDARTSSITWAGVGNVDVVLLKRMSTEGRTREDLVARGGIVGYRIPSLRPATLPVGTGDTLIMTTDGVRGGFADHVDIAQRPQENADSILARFGKRTDDALVVVAQYRGNDS
jgi:negative regulator of sigma-B (phosphoserine phosphatase)